MSVDLSDEVALRLKAAKAPVGYAALRKALVRKSKGVSEDVLKEAISAAVNEGRAFHWGNYRGSKQCYWHTKRDQLLNEKIVESCSGTAQIQSKVKVTGFTPTSISTAVNELLKAGTLQRYPGIGLEKARIGASPKAYAAALREFVLKKLDKANVAQEVFFSPSVGAQAAAELGPRDASTRQAGLEMSARILEALPRLERPGLPVASVVLRRSLGINEINKPEFDRAILDLKNERKVYLSAHHDPHGLALPDRMDLIDGGDGRYYVAVTLLVQS
jgi:hypothetical protein